MPRRLALLPLLVGCLVAVLFSARVLAEAGPVVGDADRTELLEVGRLAEDAVPARVVSGGLDAAFVPYRDPKGVALTETRAGVAWWRVTARRDIAADAVPHLVLAFPGLNRVDAYRPGVRQGHRLAVAGLHADPSHSARALFVILPEGLDAGESVYLRLSTLAPMRIPVGVESLATAHRKDLAYVGWRVGVMAMTLLLAVLVVGFWVAVREPSYLYLMLALCTQMLYVATIGGDLRLFPDFAEFLGRDIRWSRLFGLVALIASNSFMAYYLDLRHRYPGIHRALLACSLSALGLIGMGIASGSAIIATVGNGVVMASLLVVAFALFRSAQARTPGTGLRVLALSPAAVMVMMRLLDRLGAWSAPEWLSYAYPAGFLATGLIVTISLVGTMKQLRRDRDHASRMASQDALTGASSRPVIERQLAEWVADAHKSGVPLSLVFFDVDHFKHINDAHGHRVGDECLKLVAMRTGNRLRPYDVLGRYGGDEMVVILPQTPLDEAVGVAENLRSAVNSRPVTIDGLSLDITLSLGVAQLVPGESAEDLVERADAALYASKSQGRDRVTAQVRRILQRA